MKIELLSTGEKKLAIKHLPWVTCIESNPLPRPPSRRKILRGIFHPEHNHIFSSVSPFKDPPHRGVHPQQRNRYIWSGSIESIDRPPLVIKGCPDWTPHFDGIIIEAQRERGSKLGWSRVDNPAGSGGDERRRLVNSTACRVSHRVGGEGCRSQRVLFPSRVNLGKNSFRRGEMRRRFVEARSFAWGTGSLALAAKFRKVASRECVRVTGKTRGNCI